MFKLLLCNYHIFLKNHGSGKECRVRNVDNGNAIYHGMKGTDTNQPLAYYKPFLVADLGVSDPDQDSFPRPGYQNAPAFCENNDKSMGTYSFNIPDDFEQGFSFIYI